MFPRSWMFFSVVLCTICWAPHVWAQDSAAAEALFRSAREAAKHGDWVTACDRFEESKRLEPAPGTVLNLARCREKLGQVASAWKSYSEAAQRLPSGDERHAFARKKARELDSRVPRLVLTPPDTEQSVVVLVQDTELSSATFGVPLPVDPGEVTVVVRRDGHEDQVSELELSEGQTLEHQLEVGRPLASSRAEPEQESATVDFAGDERPSSSGKGAGYAFLAVGGVGLTAAAAGGVWAAIELPKVNDEDNCVDGRCLDAGVEAAARGRRAVYLMGAGAAVAVTGFSVAAYLLSKKTEAVSRRSGPSMAVVPLRGGGGLVFRTDL